MYNGVFAYPSKNTEHEGMCSRVRRDRMSSLAISELLARLNFVSLFLVAWGVTYVVTNQA